MMETVLMILIIAGDARIMQKIPEWIWPFFTILLE